jgi:glycosyltransferase involved in cell wall biosynthesis
MAPRVTIGIPVYNEELFLSEAIKSVINQLYYDIKIIIIDNASTDNSYDIAVGFSRNDKRIEVVRNKKNVGLIENFRIALSYAYTEYFVWLGAHDIFNEDYISSSIDFLDKNQDVVMVYPKYAVFIDKNNNEIDIEDACSDIDTKSDRNAINRMLHIITSLNSCTNIHGIFRTAILKKLPIKKVIGSDHLVLAMAGVYGQIHALPIEGIRRREFRFQSHGESIKRWEQSGVFKNKEKNPYKRLIYLHLYYFLTNKKISLKQKILNFFYVKRVLNDKFLCLNVSE